MQVITNPLQPLLASLEDFRDMQTLNRRIGDIFEYLDRDQSVSLSMHELNSGLRRLKYRPPISLGSDDWDSMVIRTGLCNARGEVDKMGFTIMIKDQMRQFILNRLVTSLAVADPIQGSMISMLKLQLSQAEVASGPAPRQDKASPDLVPASFPTSMSADLVLVPGSSTRHPASPKMYASVMGQQPTPIHMEGGREEQCAGQGMVGSDLLQVLEELKRSAAEQKRMLRDMRLKRDEEWKKLTERLESAWATQQRREDESARDRARQTKELEQRLFAIVEELFRKQEQTLKQHLVHSLSVASATHEEAQGNVMGMENKAESKLAAAAPVQPHHRQHIRHQLLQRSPIIVGSAGEARNGNGYGEQGRELLQRPVIVGPTGKARALTRARSETHVGLPRSPWREVELQQAKEKEALARQRDALLSCLYEEKERADWERARALELEQGLEYLTTPRLMSDITNGDSSYSDVFNRSSAAASFATLSREHVRDHHHQIDGNGSGGGSDVLHLQPPSSDPGSSHHAHVAGHLNLNSSGANVLIGEWAVSGTPQRSFEAESPSSQSTPRKEELSSAVARGMPRKPASTNSQGKWKRHLQIRAHDQPASTADIVTLASAVAQHSRERRTVSKEQLLGDLREELGRSRSGIGKPARASPFTADAAALKGRLQVWTRQKRLVKKCAEEP